MEAAFHFDIRFKLVLGKPGKTGQKKRLYPVFVFRITLRCPVFGFMFSPKVPTSTRDLCCYFNHNRILCYSTGPGGMILNIYIYILYNLPVYPRTTCMLCCRRLCTYVLTVVHDTICY